MGELPDEQFNTGIDDLMELAKCVYVYVYMYVYICTCVCVYMYTCVYMYIYVCRGNGSHLFIKKRGKRAQTAAKTQP